MSWCVAYEVHDGDEWVEDFVRVKTYTEAVLLQRELNHPDNADTVRNAEIEETST